MHHSALIEDLAVVLSIAAFVTILFQKIKQPPILGYLIAGLIIGPYTPPFSFIDDETEINVLAQLGVIFLMFSLGLEFTLNKLSKVGFSAVFTAFFEVLTMILLGFIGAYFMGWNKTDSLLIGMALSISSTTIIIKSLENLQLKKQAFASLTVGVLIIEDLLAILMLVFVYASGTMEHVTPYFLATETFKLALMVLSWFLLGFFFIPSIMNRIQGIINQETLTIMSIGLCLFLSAFAVANNYSAALGAFIMGTILAETKQSKRIQVLTQPIRDVFAAVFFVSVGLLIDPVTIFNNWPSILALTLLTIIGKLLTSCIGAILSGQKLETGIKVGCAMAQIGEFSFIIIGIGGMFLFLSDRIYPVIVSIATITTFTTPYLMKYSDRFYLYLQKNMPWVWEEKIKAYASRVNRRFQGSHHFSPKAKCILRFSVNGLFVAILFEAMDMFIPIFSNGSQQGSEAAVVLAIFTYILSLPFLWAMIYYCLPHQGIGERLAFSVLWRIVTWGILFFFGWLYTGSFIHSFYMLLGGIAFLVLLQKPLRYIYLQIEKVFIENLNLKISYTQEE